MGNNPLVTVIIPTYNREKDVVACIHSIEQSTYRSFEIIVVDNRSTDNTVDAVRKTESYGKDNFTLICLEENLMAAGGRNAGILKAKGEFLLFVDSDNIVHPQMIEQLVTTMSENEQIGLLGPLMMYFEDQQRIWFVSNKMSLLTSKVTYFYANCRLDQVRLPLLLDTDHLPNVFMVRRSVQQMVGGFDEMYYIMYEESDFASRIRKCGYEIKTVTSAITYHNCYLPERITDNEMRKLGCTTLERTYHFSKNRIIYMRKYAPWYGKLCYLLLFQWGGVIYYCIKALKNRRPDMAWQWLKGLIDGLFLKVDKEVYIAITQSSAISHGGGDR